MDITQLSIAHQVKTSLDEKIKGLEGKLRTTSASKLCIASSTSAYLCPGTCQGSSIFKKASEGVGRRKLDSACNIYIFIYTPMADRNYWHLKMRCETQRAQVSIILTATLRDPFGCQGRGPSTKPCFLRYFEL